MTHMLHTSKEAYALYFTAIKHDGHLRIRRKYTCYVRTCALNFCCPGIHKSENEKEVKKS